MGETSLFQAEGSTALPDLPALRGGRCGACGFVFFPMQHFGCERCGDVAQLQPMLLSGRGRLLNAVKVHVHNGSSRVAPFWVGSVVTDDGAFVRSILDVNDDQQPESGATLVAHLVGSNETDDLDLHFIAEGMTLHG